jgi:opacity protein-like surface antigen
MKRILVTAVIAVSLIASAAFAGDSSAGDSLAANGFFFKPYVGADYDFYHVDYSNGNSGVFSDSLNGGDIHVGARVHKYLGFEVSYFDTANESKDNVLGTSISTSAKLDGWSLDAMGYLPLGDSQKFELIGTVGLARTTAKGTASNGSTALSLSDSETKGRIGGGAQYWITDNLNVRGLVRYQDANFEGTIDDAVVYSLGLNWQF